MHKIHTKLKWLNANPKSPQRRRATRKGKIHSINTYFFSKCTWNTSISLQKHEHHEMPIRIHDIYFSPRGCTGWISRTNNSLMYKQKRNQRNTLRNNRLVDFSKHTTEELNEENKHNQHTLIGGHSRLWVTGARKHMAPKSPPSRNSYWPLIQSSLWGHQPGGRRSIPQNR
jgi:hypothetical protein